MRKNLSHRNVLAFFIFVACYLGLSAVGFAQIGDPGGGDDVPITGIEWLLAAGGVLGVRKVLTNLRNRRRCE